MTEKKAVRLRIRSKMSDLVLDDMLRDKFSHEARKAYSNVTLNKMLNSFGMDDAKIPDELFSDGENPDKLSYDDLLVSDDSGSHPVTDIIDFSTDALLTCGDGKFSVSYSEGTMLGMENAATTLSFSMSSPELVTMIRTGDGAMTLSFSEKSPRQVCLYSVAGGTMELIVGTRKVINTLTPEGGRLLLDYIIEIRGLKTEHTLFALEMTSVATGCVSAD